MQLRGTPHQRQVHAAASRVRKHGQSFFEVQAAGIARAAPQQAWNVLTDYERLDEFVPDLVASRILSRDTNEAIIEQESRTAILLLVHTVRMVVRIEEQPCSVLNVERMSGDMRHYRARWEIEPASEAGNAGTHIALIGAMEPDFPLPPVVGDAIIQVNVKNMVEAVIREIERRHMH